MEYLRGDIVYIENNKTNAEDHFNTGRPVLIVSADDINEHSQYVSVATISENAPEDKKKYCAEIFCKCPSYAICNNVFGIHKSKIVDWVRSCTPEEMQKVGVAMKNAFALIDTQEKYDNSLQPNSTQKLVEAASVSDNTRLIELETQLNVYKEMYSNLLHMLKG